MIVQEDQPNDNTFKQIDKSIIYSSQYYAKNKEELKYGVFVADEDSEPNTDYFSFNGIDNENKYITIGLTKNNYADDKSISKTTENGIFEKYFNTSGEDESLEKGYREGKIHIKDSDLYLFFNCDNKKFEIAKINIDKTSNKIKCINKIDKIDAVITDFENKKLYAIKDGRKYEVINNTNTEEQIKLQKYKGFKKSAKDIKTKKIKKMVKKKKNKAIEIKEKEENQKKEQEHKEEEKPTNNINKKFQKNIACIDGSIIVISYDIRSKKIKIEKKSNSNGSLINLFCDDVEDFGDAKFLKITKDGQELFLDTTNFKLYEKYKKSKSYIEDNKEIVKIKNDKNNELELHLTDQTYREEYKKQLEEKQKEMEEKKRAVEEERQKKEEKIKVFKDKYSRIFYKKGGDYYHCCIDWIANNNFVLRNTHIKNEDETKEELNYTYDENEGEYCFKPVSQPDILFWIGNQILVKNFKTKKVIWVDQVEEDVKNERFYVIIKGKKFLLNTETCETTPVQNRYWVDDLGGVNFTDQLGKTQQVQKIDGETVFEEIIVSGGQMSTISYDKDKKSFVLHAHEQPGNTHEIQKDIVFQEFEILDAANGLIKIIKDKKEYLLKHSGLRWYTYEKKNDKNKNHDTLVVNGDEKSDYVLVKEDFDYKIEKIADKNIIDVLKRKREYDKFEIKRNEILDIKDTEEDRKVDDNNKKDINHIDEFCLFFTKKRGGQLQPKIFPEGINIKEIEKKIGCKIEVDEESGAIKIIKEKNIFTVDTLLMQNGGYYVYDGFIKYKLNIDNLDKINLNPKKYLNDKDNKENILIEDVSVGGHKEIERLRKDEIHDDKPIKVLFTTEGRKINIYFDKTKSCFTINYFDENGEKQTIDVDEFEDFNNAEFLKIKIKNQEYFFNLSTGFKFKEQVFNEKNREDKDLLIPVDLIRQNQMNIDINYFADYFVDERWGITKFFGNYIFKKPEHDSIFDIKGILSMIHEACSSGLPSNIWLRLNGAKDGVDIVMCKEDLKKLIKFQHKRKEKRLEEEKKMEKQIQKLYDERKKKEAEEEENMWREYKKEKLDYIENILKRPDIDNSKEYQFNTKDILKDMFSDSKIKKAYKEALNEHIYQIRHKFGEFDINHMFSFLSNDYDHFYKTFMENFRNKKIPDKKITYFEYVKQEILKGCGEDTQKKLKEIMNDKNFKTAFDAIFAELLIKPLFYGEKSYYDYDPLNCLIEDISKKYKNYDLIKLSNASVLITKFLVNNDKKNEKNYFNLKEQGVQPFLNNIDGNFYRLLKILDNSGVLEDIDFEILDEEINTGGSGILGKDNIRKTYYIKPKLKFKEELNEVHFALYNDIVSKKPTSRHCLDVLQDLYDNKSLDFGTSNECNGFDGREVFDIKQLIECKINEDERDFKKEQEEISRFRNVAQYPYHLANLMYRQMLFYNNTWKLDNNLRHFNFKRSCDRDKKLTTNEFKVHDIKIHTSSTSMENEISEQIKQTDKNNYDFAKKNSLKIIHRARKIFDPMFNCFINGNNNNYDENSFSIKADNKKDTIHVNFLFVNKKANKVEEINKFADKHKTFVSIGGFRHDFGKHNFLDNFTDSRGVFLSSSTKEIWSLLFKGKSNSHLKILTIDKNPLDNDAEKKHLEIDVSLNNDQKQIENVKLKQIDISNDIRAEFFNVLNKFLESRNFIIDLNTFIRKTKKNEQGKIEYSQKPIYYHKNDVFLEKVDYDKATNKCTMKFKRHKVDHINNYTYDIEKFTWEENFELSPTLMESSESFFDTCAEGLVNFIKGIIIENQNEWNDEKIVSDINLISNHKRIEKKKIKDVKCVTLNEIFNEKETISDFKKFYFNQFKKKIEELNKGPIGIDKDVQNKIEQFTKDNKNTEEARNIILNMQKESQQDALQNINNKVQKHLKEKRDVKVMSLIKQGKFSTVGNLIEHKKKVFSLFHTMETKENNQRIYEEAEEKLKDDKQYQKQLAQLAQLAPIKEELSEDEESEEIINKKTNYSKRNINKKVDIELNWPEIEDIVKKDSKEEIYQKYGDLIKYNGTLYVKNVLEFSISLHKDLIKEKSKFKFNELYEGENSKFFSYVKKSFTKYIDSNIDNIMLICSKVHFVRIISDATSKVFDFLQEKYNDKEDQFDEIKKRIKYYERKLMCTRLEVELTDILKHRMKKYYKEFKEWQTKKHYEKPEKKPNNKKSSHYKKRLQKSK